MILGDHFHMTSYFLRHLLNIPIYSPCLFVHTFFNLYIYDLKSILVTFLP